MSVEIITKDDLETFRLQLMDDLKKLLSGSVKTDGGSEWLKSKEVRSLLKVSPGTLQNLRINGTLKPVKIEGTWYYNRDQIMSLFEKGGM